jgi:hypothetical protein
MTTFTGCSTDDGIIEKRCIWCMTNPGTDMCVRLRKTLNAVAYSDEVKV